MQRRKFIAMGASAVTVLAAGCSEDDTSDSASSSDGNGNESSDGGNGDDSGGKVEILEHETQTAEFGNTINVVGEIQNNTGEEQSYIEITAVFYNAEGTRVDDSMTNFTDVPDGETIAFEIMTTLEESEFDNYELETSTSV